MICRSKRTSWLLVFVLLYCGGSAQAQESLKRRMSVSYQGAAIASVFTALANVLGCRLQLDQRLSGTVTLEVRNVTAETVLRAVCESAGCRWRLDRDRLVVEIDPAGKVKPQPDPYSEVKIADVHQEIPAHILWSDAPLEGVAKTFGQMLDALVLLDDKLVNKRVSLDQDRGTAWSALNAVCQRASCRWQFASEPKRRLAVVPEPGVTAPKLVSSGRPTYTEAAKQAGFRGMVSVECVVQQDGTVGQVRVVQAPDKVYGLDVEAVLAARLHLFEPGTRDGKPVPVVVRLTFSFTPR
jgi:TonB family protein